MAELEEPSTYRQLIQRQKERFNLLLEQHKVATQKLHYSMDGLKEKVLGSGGRLGTQDLVGLIGGVAEFMRETNAFRDGMIEAMESTADIPPSAIRKQITEMLVASIEAKGENYNLEEWRTGTPGAMLEGRIETLTEILDLLRSERNDRNAHWKMFLALAELKVDRKIRLVYPAKRSLSHNGYRCDLPHQPMPL